MCGPRACDRRRGAGSLYARAVAAAAGDVVSGLVEGGWGGITQWEWTREAEKEAEES